MKGARPMHEQNTTNPHDGVQVKFTTNTTFSLRCGNCADIHNAQLEGKSNKPCECDCHGNPPQYIPYYPNYPQSPIWCVQEHISEPQFQYDWNIKPHVKNCEASKRK